MGTSILLSRLIGALAASVLAVFYQYVSLISTRRFEIMLLAVDYLDEINYLTRQIEQYKGRKYTENREVMTPEEYRSLCNRLDSLLTSSKIHARVALVYGENSATLEKFNQLRKKMTDTTVNLFNATPSNWLQASAQLRDAFETDIDPLRLATELELLRGAGFKAALLDTPGLARSQKSFNP